MSLAVDTQMNDMGTLVLGVNWLLCAIFLHAVDHKLRAPMRFTAILAAYKVMPESLVPLAARLVMLLECLTVLATLFAWPWGLPVAAALLLVYAFAMAVNKARGRAYIDCGCGDTPTPLSTSLLVRNGILVTLAMAASMLHGTSSFTPLGWLDIVTAAFAAAAATGLYLAFEQILANNEYLD
ncbi:MAG: methylamine utilization protein MauE [Pseudomonadales bacterium]|nr:methylamine utilization protein MauE [Pseudomonadales bacterium]MCP5182578.1 methylamine utilization protein MauE [Pseudomonadales bacterium]